MGRTFQVQQVRDWINQLYAEKITFSRFVEILNEQAAQKKIIIKKLDTDLHWFKWLSEGESHGLSEAYASDAIKDITKKVNELIELTA